MIGKRVAVFPDVRLKQAKAYGNVSYDAGGLDHKSIGLLLQITGEDVITVGRKMIDAWEGRLATKIICLSNEVPNLNDATLITRFIKVRFGVSFAANPDVRLKEKLEAELPSIPARCVSAYRRLCARGEFIQPTSGLALDRQIVAASDAFAALPHSYLTVSSRTSPGPTL